MRLSILRKCQSLNSQTLALVERRMRFALTRFSPIINGVSVSLIDESGPHGAPTKKCLIAVRLTSQKPLIVEGVGESHLAAASQAADRIQRSVARQLHRRRDAKRYQRRRSRRQMVVEESSAEREG